MQDMVEHLYRVLGIHTFASWKDPEDMDTYLDRADEAMYQEKKQYYERNHIERRRQGDRN